MLAVSVQLELGTEATVHCGAYKLSPDVAPSAQQEEPGSIYDVMAQRHSVVANGGVAHLTIDKLSAATAYNVYCLTESFKGVLMSTSSMLTQYATTRTACCKTIFATLEVTSLFEGEGSVSVITFSLDALPSLWISVTPVLNASEVDSTPSTNPRSFFISNTSVLQSSYTVGWKAGAAASYSAMLEVTGPSAAEFKVIFVEGVNMLTVRYVNQEPPTPTILSARFSSDGRSVLLLFSAPTNRAGFTNDFQCSHVLHFSGIDKAACRWSDSRTIVIYPATVGNSEEVLGVNSNITIVGSNAVTAACTGDPESCSGWSSVSSSTLTVVAPADPTTPSVVLSMPFVVSSCAAVTVDLTGSTGSGGRPWLRPTFSVASDDTSGGTVVKELLNTAFVINPPTEIPSHYFTVGATYSISATLCNFLGACGVASRSVLINPDQRSIPIAKVIGNRLTTIQVSDSILLTSQAYTVDCNGTQVSTGLQYSWTVRLDGLIQLGLVSLSRDSSKFRLDSFQLNVRKTYAVELTVRSLENGASAQDTVLIYVEDAPIVAHLASGIARTAVVGEAILVDASASYDGNIPGVHGLATGLSFNWGCTQILPVFAFECGLDYSSGQINSFRGDRLQLFAGNHSINSTSRVAVTVTDRSRSSSTYSDITVRISAADLNIILPPQSTQSVSSFRTSERLQLTGIAVVESPCHARWSVDDQSISLRSNLLTPLSVSIPAFTARTMNFVLEANSLPSRGSVTFSLSCGPSTASFQVVTNSPPLPGSFTVTPNEGTELSTVFRFSADAWTDVDLPLTYQFGFISSSSRSKLLIKSRSDSIFGSSTLPAGPGTANAAAGVGAIECVCEVFDKLDAVELVASYIKVSPAASVEQLQSNILATLSRNRGDVESMRQSIAVGSTVLNAVNCTLAPNCTELNRSPCSRTSHTCGACLAGYVGDEGPANAQCISATTVISAPGGSSSMSNSTLGTSCTSTEDCRGWEVCDAVIATCIIPMKSCSQNCSGQGTCSFVNINSLKSIKRCQVNDPTCRARCACFSGFKGSLCDITEAKQKQQQEVRGNLLSSLSDVTQLDDISDESVEAWTSNLWSLVQNPSEISVNDVGLIQDIASDIIAGANDLPLVTSQDLSEILSIIDTIIAVIIDGEISAGETTLLTSRSVSLVLQYNEMVSAELLAGQSDVEHIGETFRTTTSVRSGEDDGAVVQVVVPSTALEKASGRSATKLAFAQPNIDSTLSYTFSVVSTVASSFGAAGSLYSANPVSIAMSNAVGSSPTEIIIVLSHNSALMYSNDTESFNTTCSGASDYSVHNYTCNSSGRSVEHICRGKPEVLTTTCPTLTPECSVLSANTTLNTHCEVMAYDADSTTCKCDVSQAQQRVRRRRRLQNSEEEYVETIGFDIVSSADYAGGEFIATLSAADEFDSFQDIQRVMIVIIMFAVLWGGGILLIGVCAWRRQRIESVTKERQLQQLEKQQEKQTVSYDPPTEHASSAALTSYVAEVFPNIFSNKPLLGRIWGEVKRHHRYWVLFKGNHTDLKRIVNCVMLLTAQSFLMFLLAWLYEIQSPTDDGSCEEHSTKIDCLARKTVLDSKQTYCEWVEVGTDHVCQYLPAALTVKATIYIAVIVAVSISLGLIPIDWIFSILTAPTADEVKLEIESQAAPNLGRRLSNVAGRGLTSAVRRVSVAVSQVSPAINLNRKSLAARETRALPRETQHARSLARQLSTKITDQSRESLRQASLRRQTTLRQASMRIDFSAIGGIDEEAVDDQDGGMNICNADSLTSEHQRLPEGTSPRLLTRGRVTPLALPTAVARADNLSPKNRLADSPPVLLQNLVGQIFSQRQSLPEELKADYDLQWGIDPTTGEFYPDADADADAGNGLCFRRTREGTEAVLMKEILDVFRCTTEKSTKLKIATDAHTGLEILHLFILDLLGKTTPAARVFEAKAGEDFRYTKVVSIRWKCVAVALLVLLNAFFIYFCILTGYRRGVAWQQAFLGASIVQFAVEVLLFETMECMWVNCAIPLIVSNDVRRVGDSVRHTVASMCKNGNTLHDPRLFLSAPDFLFVSTNLAKKFPSVMESTLVLSYYSHVPGELSRKWQRSSQHSVDGQRQGQASQQEGTWWDALAVWCFSLLGPVRSVRRVGVMTTVLSSLQHFASAPFIVHRLFIRFMQPITLTGIVLLFYTAASNPIYIGMFFGLLALGAGTGLVVWAKKHKCGSAVSSKPLLPTTVTPAPAALTSGVAGYDGGPVQLSDDFITPHTICNPSTHIATHEPRQYRTEAATVLAKQDVVGVDRNHIHPTKAAAGTGTSEVDVDVSQGSDDESVESPDMSNLSFSSDSSDNLSSSSDAPSSIFQPSNSSDNASQIEVKMKPRVDVMGLSVDSDISDSDYSRTMMQT